MNRRIFNPIQHLLRNEAKSRCVCLACPRVYSYWTRASKNSGDASSSKDVIVQKRTTNVPALSMPKISDLIPPVEVLPEKIDTGQGKTVSSILNKAKLEELLDSVASEPDIKGIMQKELSIDDKIFEIILKSFHTFCLSPDLPEDLHSVLHNLTENDGLKLGLLPALFEHALNMYPHLIAVSELKYLVSENMTNPVNWYPEARKLKRRVIYHHGPTNSGKTHSAMNSFVEAKTGIYLAPLRLLAIECFTSTNQKDVPCDLITGERRYFINSEDQPANHRSCTIELLDFTTKYDVAIIDEIQMIGDAVRGGSWTQALVGVLADEIHVCGDISAVNIVKRIVEQCGDTFELKSYRRKGPLVVQKSALITLDNVEAGDCIVCFQVKDLFEVGDKLTAMGHNCALIYGALPPALKMQQTNSFNDTQNPCNILVATDAIGMGLNLAIKRIIFYSTKRKGLVENNDKKYLSTSEALQIAGRAGRFGGVYEKEGGMVTTLKRKDLDYLHFIMKQKVPTIQKAGLIIRDDIIETFAQFLPGLKFSKILILFTHFLMTNEQYFMCDTRLLIKNAALIDSVEMPVRQKLLFCMVPLRNHLSQLTTIAFMQMAELVSKGSPITLDWLLKSTAFEESKLTKPTEFDKALEIFHLTDIFMWLSHKFPEFANVDEMRSFRLQLNKALQNYIENKYSNKNTGTFEQENQRGKIVPETVETNQSQPVEKSLGQNVESNSRVTTDKLPSRQLQTTDVESEIKSKHLDLSLQKKGEDPVRKNRYFFKKLKERQLVLKKDNKNSVANKFTGLSPSEISVQRSKKRPKVRSSFHLRHTEEAESHAEENVLKQTGYKRIPTVTTKKSINVLDQFKILVDEPNKTDNKKDEIKTGDKEEQPVMYMEDELQSRPRTSMEQNTDGEEVKQPSSDRRMEGFRYFLQKAGFSFMTGSLEWRALSETQRTKFIEDAEQIKMGNKS